MTGALDEVKIWNRTLSRDEIREQRHLTLPQSVVEADPDLVAYYQFNEDTHFLVNKRGSSTHGTFSGGSTLAASAAVVGSGVLDRVMVDGPGMVPLPTVGGSIDVPQGAASPGGEVVVHRLDPTPPSAPDQFVPAGHWVVDEYGSGDFDAEVMWTMGTEDGMLTPWADGMGSLSVVSRDPLGQAPWTAPCGTMAMTGSSADMDAGCMPMGNGQFALVSDLCAFDTTEVDLCPGETFIWGNDPVEETGTYYALGTLSGACETLEVLHLEMLNPPMLDWVEMAGTITVFGDWVDHQWTLNGTALDATGPIIDTPPAGSLTLVAVDPGTGCTASLTATLGCPGDLNEDYVVGVSDVLLLLGGFGCMEDCWDSDVNGDGIVNVSDVLFLLGLFGTVC